jgi:hypothetical protein
MLCADRIKIDQSAENGVNILPMNVTSSWYFLQASRLVIENTNMAVVRAREVPFAV